MIKTPKSLRLQIAIFGRTNVGKSSFLNMIAGQDVALTSNIPGTTTDVVEKSMELLPIGPVTLLDTAGIDDVSELSGKRIEKSMKIFDRADIIILLTEAGNWTGFEDQIVAESKKNNLPLIVIINKNDLKQAKDEFLAKLREKSPHVLSVTSLATHISKENRDKQIIKIKETILDLCPEEFKKERPLLGDLIPKGGMVIFIVPIDNEAPKGRIILPQVQAIRDILDHDSLCMVVKETEYKQALASLKNPPDLVVCDSQVVHLMVEQTPPEIPCTTFSILFSRFKGDIREQVKGAAAIDMLKPGGNVLIAEACSHHPNEDDIGRVKLPGWLRKHLGFEINIDHSAGRDYPDEIAKYDLIIHCGACMLTRHEQLIRIKKAYDAGIPITNYGVAISELQGVLKRVIEPIPEARDLIK